MTIGDCMAQELERYHVEEDIFKADGHNEEEKDKFHRAIPGRRLSLRRYNSTATIANDNEDGMDKYQPPPARPPSTILYDDGAQESTFNWSESVSIIADFLMEEIHNIDWVRSTTMGTWAVFIFSPGYMFLYATLDKVFPLKTPTTIIARVLISMVYSIPMNTLFFTYSTSAHHTLEWWNLRREVMLESEEKCNFTDYHEPLILPPYDVEMMISKAKLKLETELVTTVKNSAKMWIPINFFSFALVPSHLRPFGLFFFSLFWNCYLSLVQHRDIVLPEEFNLSKDDTILIATNSARVSIDQKK